MQLSHKLFVTIVPVAALACVLTGPLNATSAMARKEKKSCKVCHVDPRSGELNEAGKHYKEHKKLPPEDAEKKKDSARASILEVLAESGL